MSSEEGISKTFRDVDRSDSPAAHVRYLAAASGLEQIRNVKENSIRLLDLKLGR